MNKLIIICLLLALVTGGFTVRAQNTLPDISVKTLEGKSVNLHDQIESGQLTVISFWATWCKPCKKELDAIADLYEDWQSSYNMKLIAISVDDARALAKVKPMVAEKAWPYEILTDSNQDLMRALNFQSVPHTILLNKQGEIVYTHSGYLPGDEEELEAQMEQLQ